jgi:hypothetical protein
MNSPDKDWGLQECFNGIPLLFKLLCMFKLNKQIGHVISYRLIYKLS